MGEIKHFACFFSDRSFFSLNFSTFNTDILNYELSNKIVIAEHGANLSHHY